MRRTRNYDQEDGLEAHGHGVSGGGGGLPGHSASPFPFAASSSDSVSNKSAPSAATESAPPCRTCTDFRTWMKMQGSGDKKSAAEEDGQQRKTVPSSSAISEEQAYRMDRELRSCPADSVDLGSSTWKLLHTMSVNFPERPTERERADVEQFVSLFGRLYPCRPCAEDFVEDLKKHPVDAASGPRLARWLCEAHNRVNEKLGKDQFDCGKVFERWRDGWKDGSCDY